MLLSAFSTSRKILFLACILCFASGLSFAQTKTEAELVQKIISSIQHKDSFAYAAVFPPADTMANITVRKAPATSDEYQRAKYLLESPEMVLYQDSMIQKQAYELYRNVLEKGERIGVHWNDILISRYELEVLPKTHDGTLEAVAPERFVGYVFIEDMQTRKIFTLTLSDMMKMDGNWYGGELNFIFEAGSKDEFNAKLKADNARRRKGLPDSSEMAANDSTASNDEENTNQRKQVADRKLYTGFLDGEIPVSLYIRYIKGDCPSGICSWEAIFKFGDNEYTRQEVSKNEDGKWVFLEEETGGVMELDLKGNIYTGIFSATLDKVDYDAELKEKTMTKKKLENLDAIIEKDINR